VNFIEFFTLDSKFITCIFIFQGMYIARQLSFHGVNFKVEEVPLCEDFKEVYDASVKLVSKHSCCKIAASI
jgi:hypothetical protein